MPEVLKLYSICFVQAVVNENKCYLFYCQLIKSVPFLFFFFKQNPFSWKCIKEQIAASKVWRNKNTDELTR